MCLPTKIEDRELERDLRCGRGIAITFITLVLTACGTATRPPARQAAPDAQPVEVATTNAVDAYVSLWKEVAVAAAASTWESPGIARHATGEALAAITRDLYADHVNGLVAKGMPASDPEVATMDFVDRPTLVVVLDCSDRTNWAKYRTDGELAVAVDTGRRSVTAQVAKQTDTSWRVTQFTVQEVGTC